MTDVSPIIERKQVWHSTMIGCAPHSIRIHDETLSGGVWRVELQDGVLVAMTEDEILDDYTLGAEPAEE